MLTISLLIGIPSVIGGAAAFGGNIIGNVTSGSLTAGNVGASQAADAGLWAGFWTALVGFVLAAAGGALGGATPRDESMYETLDLDDRPVDRVEVIHEDADISSTSTRR